MARPGLSAVDLAGLLVGTAHPLPQDSVESQGAGLIDLGTAAAAELSVTPATLALPPGGSKLHVVRTLSVRNVSTRRVRVRVSGGVDGEVFSLTFSPTRFALRPGKSRQVKVVANAAHRLPEPIEGAVKIAPRSGPAARVPWLAAP